MSTRIDVGSLVTSKLRVFARDLELGCATGFFVEHKGRLFLVTNWHVVSGRHFQTGKPMDEQKATLPDRLRYLAPCKGHDGEWMEAECLLYKDANDTRAPEAPVWFEHGAHGHKIDVVAIPITLPDGATAHTIDRVNTVPKLLLSISRDVFVLGYPRGIDGGRGFPIWKRASIATEPEIQLDGLPKMLIDTATREGMSGAPVIAIADGDFDVEGQPAAYRKPGRVYRFVGVYSGRLGRGEMEAQLGIVWRERALSEILDVPTEGRSSFGM
jgi:hypothetical protein